MALTVKNPYSKIQVSCKSDPKGVGNLKQRRLRGDGIIFHNCADNQEQKKQKPEKSKAKGTHIKEYNAPQKVYRKAYAIGPECRPLFRFKSERVVPYFGGADAH